MAGATRFTFDREFTADGKVRTVRKAEEQVRLAEAEQTGYQRGQIDGRRDAEQEALAQTAAAAERIAAMAQEVLARVDGETARLEREAALLALAFARKIAGDVSRLAPFAVLEDAAGECFRQLVGVPHIVVRIEESMLDRTKTLLDKLARERGFEGRVVLLGETGLQAGDFTIEWADGGIVRDGAALERLIEAAVDRRFPAPSVPGDMTGPE